MIIAAFCSGGRHAKDFGYIVERHRTIDPEPYDLAARFGQARQHDADTQELIFEACRRLGNQPLNFRRVERQTSDATGIRHTGVEQRPIDIAGHIAHRTRGVVALGHAQIYVVEYILGIGRAPDMVAHIAEKLLLVRFHIIGQLSYEFVPVHAV